jgi:hypothetical protein
LKYAKMLGAVVATVLAALVASWTDGVTSQEWVNVAIAGTTAAAVFTAPNVPGSRYTKAVLAVLGAVLAFLVTAIAGGVDSAELLQIGVLVLGALGVTAVPNKDGDVNLSDTGSVGTH